MLTLTVLFNRQNPGLRYVPIKIKHKILLANLKSNSEIVAPR
jgi:hypothetical protein